MNVIGAITELNPLHNGHAYFFEKAKEQAGADALILVMSGDFVQRGEPAICDKYLRTEAALSCGADLVLELPVIFATASAPYFAAGGVLALRDTNLVDTLVFGSEFAGDERLGLLFEIEQNEPPRYVKILRGALKDGLPFARAKAIALSEITGIDDCDPILSAPNTKLSLAYAKAIARLAPGMKMHAVSRIGSSYHSESMDDAYASATAIRRALLSPEVDTASIQRAMPESASSLFLSAMEKDLPVTSNDLSLLLQVKLLSLTEEDRFFDVQPDLLLRILSLRDRFVSAEQFAMVVKTRNYTLSHVRRSLIHILLDIRPEHVLSDAARARAPYLRVLGFRKDREDLVREIAKKTSAPLLLRRKDADRLLPEARTLYDLDTSASHLHAAVRAQKFNCPYVADERRPLIIR